MLLVFVKVWTYGKGGGGGGVALGGFSLPDLRLVGLDVWNK